MKNIKNHHSTGIYTLVFFIQNQQVLLLKRNKEPNSGKFNGIGGKIEQWETPRQAMIREAFEESGLRVIEARSCGILRCVDTKEEKDYLIFLYLCKNWSGEIVSSLEGDLFWIDIANLQSIEIVDNIPHFFPLMLSCNNIELTYEYHEDGTCIWHGWTDQHFQKGAYRFL